MVLPPGHATRDIRRFQAPPGIVRLWGLTMSVVKMPAPLPEEYVSIIPSPDHAKPDSVRSLALREHVHRLGQIILAVKLHLPKLAHPAGEPAVLQRAQVITLLSPGDSATLPSPTAAKPPR